MTGASRLVVFLALAATTLPCGASAQATAQSQSPASQTQATRLAPKLQAWLDSLTAASRFPGITAGIAFADGSTLGIASGFADTARKVRMTPASRLMQGSVGKTYVSAVALQLVHEGKIKLDEPIATYLGREPWFARLANGRDVTVRMLMNHTSGVVRYEFKPEFTRDLTASPDRVWKPEELIAYLLDTPAPFAAGSAWEYSDSNYILLGMIIERVTGSTYYAEMKRRLLEPHALRNTVPSDSRTIPGLVQGYAGPSNQFGGTDAMIGADGRFAINPQFEWTGGGIVSTSEDLARWMRIVHTGKAFDPSLLAQFRTGVPARLGQGVQYGLGVIIRPTPLGTAYGHSGFFPGYLTETLYFPDIGTAVAVQVNTSARSASPNLLLRAVNELARIVAEGR
jgi:D-alanyl-D-alanine carboxypeptidase